MDMNDGKECESTSQKPKSKCINYEINIKISKRS